MTFAKRVFLIAGIYGTLVIAPQLFLEARFSRENPPAITHPEFYYGFVATALAWQVAFLIISRDPVRYRPLMPAMLIEKGLFAAAIPVLFAQGRVPALLLLFAAIDAVFGVLFWMAWRRTRLVDVPRAKVLHDRPVTMEERPSTSPDTEVLLLDLGRALDRTPPSS